MNTIDNTIESHSCSVLLKIHRDAWHLHKCILMDTLHLTLIQDGEEFYIEIHTCRGL
jgi:hypothetical protein